MKARFQIFKAPFYFVGWLAPAYGKGEANSSGITFVGWLAPAYGKGGANSCGITFVGWLTPAYGKGEANSSGITPQSLQQPLTSAYLLHPSANTSYLFHHPFYLFCPAARYGSA